MEINFYATRENCEVCGLEIAETRVEMHNWGEEYININLCPSCERKLYDALRERQFKKMIQGYASNE